MRSSLGELLKYQYLDMAIQKCSQLRLRQSTNLLSRYCAIFEQNQSWDTADAKLAVMEECGFKVTKNPSEMASLLKAMI
mgnify:CR=1 FL=1